MFSATKAKKIVIKVGTSTLMHKTGKTNLRKIEGLVRVISDLKNSGKEVIIVSSGAIAVGSQKLGYKKRPSEVAHKQATAAVEIGRAHV